MKSDRSKVGMAYISEKNKVVRMVAFFVYSAIFILVAVLIFVVDFKGYKAGGGAGSIAIVIGSIVGDVLEGVIGKLVFTILSIFCAVFYLRKAIELLKQLSN